MRRFLFPLTFALGLSAPVPALAAEEEGKRSPNMRFVKNIPYRDFYLYGNDIARGLDIYKFDGAAEKANATGRWASGKSLPVGLPRAPITLVDQRRSLLCLL